MASCKHDSLCFDVSSHADEAGYRRPTPRQRLGAVRPSGQAPVVANPSHNGTTAVSDVPPDCTFPAPLVLPSDELSWDPKCPPQSLRSWTQEKARNAVTDERRTVYLIPPSAVADEVGWVRDWAVPDLKAKTALPPPDFADVLSYLQAFYHGLPVKVLREPTVRFGAWESKASGTKGRKAAKKHQHRDLGLETGSEMIRIRTRPGDPLSQLNLNDLLDAAIEILPDDAYALLMIVNQDLYEDDDDEFCCGRAYGGSRVAVVSSARYNPLLDQMHEVDREHAWPASHCRQHVEVCCGVVAKGRTKSKKRKLGAAEDEKSDPGKTAMGAALEAHQTCTLRAAHAKKAVEDLRALWLGRVCKTASHELGHCFGIGHCVYYACVMQGTAGLGEDARQPPYLCPVDTAKLLKATGAREDHWLEALLAYCERWEDDTLFAAYAAWLRIRVQNTGESRSGAS